MHLEINAIGKYCEYHGLNTEQTNPYLMNFKFKGVTSGSLLNFIY